MKTVIFRLLARSYTTARAGSFDMMDTKHAFKTIDRATFDALLAQYPAVLPDKLSVLDEQRYTTIPQALKQRREAGDAHLTKDEVLTLVIWKVSHGKFRPTLQALVRQNDASVVATTTREAFTDYDQGGADATKTSLTRLAQLRGIGPATASLLLSALDPHAVPFFAVGLFAWAMGVTGSGRELERGIKYSAKEYLELHARVRELRDRLGVTAEQAEKVGYVLGKTGGLAGAGPAGEEESTAKIPRKRKSVSEERPGTKAQDGDQIPPPTRSSTRKKARQ